MEAFFQPKRALVLGCFFFVVVVCLFCFVLLPALLLWVRLASFLPLCSHLSSPNTNIIWIFQKGEEQERRAQWGSSLALLCFRGIVSPCQPQSRNAKQLLPAPRVLGRGVTSGWCLLGCAWEGDFCKGCAEHKRRI